MNEKSFQKFMAKYIVIDELIEILHCIHVHKCLTPRHDYSSVPHRVARQAHRRTVTRRCVLLAGWPSPRGNFQPGSSPL
jgi:hypothetical protein